MTVLKCDAIGCNLSFRKFHNFFDHLRTHTGEKPYSCDVKGCTAKFAQKVNRNKHILTHKKSKGNLCKPCNKYIQNPLKLKV